MASSTPWGLAVMGGKQAEPNFRQVASATANQHKPSTSKIDPKIIKNQCPRNKHTHTQNAVFTPYSAESIALICFKRQSQCSPVGLLKTPMAVLQLGSQRPQVAPSTWVAPGAQVVGDVRLGEEVSVWFNCVLRGDDSYVEVGGLALQ